MEQPHSLFSSLKLSPSIMQALTALGFKEPSPIQAQAIPPLMDGKDVIGLAATGTGKTAAFSIPAIERIDVSKRQTQVLIVCPTRELSVQVCTHVQELSKFKAGIKATAVFGGQAIEPQMTALRHGSHVVVGTPGRLLDLLKRRSLNLSTVNTVVLDEADQMLDMGFYEDIMYLLENTPVERQTVLFSATMSPRILKLAKALQKNPVSVTIQNAKTTAPLIRQMHYLVQPRSKDALLARVIWFHQPERVIVFSNTKAGCEDVAHALKKRGISAQPIHGDLDQSKRLRIMQAFRDGSIKILVATDVAARGIDVSGVDIVVNFELPRDPESYVHRIGRTGRAGAEGLAISLVSPRELRTMRMITQLTNAPIPAEEIPSDDEVMACKVTKMMNMLQAAVSDYQTLLPYKELLNEQCAEIPLEMVAAALLKQTIAHEPERVDAALPSDDYEQSRGGGRSRGGYGDYRGGGQRRYGNSEGRPQSRRRY